MEKVLITGGNGFLGSNVARELFNRGYKIKLMMRPMAATDILNDINCDMFYGDIGNLHDVLMAVSDCSYVIHTASITQQWGVTFEEYERINITGTKNVVEACLLHNVKRLIHVSTANTLGPGSIDKPGNELNSFSLLHLNSGYINTKYIAQQYVSEQVERRKLSAIIINPTFMIGPHDSKPSSGKIIFHGLNKRLIFYPSGGKNFVHIQDVCASIANALIVGSIGDCYLIAGENLSYRSFFKLLNEVADQKTFMIKIPSFFLKTAGLIGSILHTLTGKSYKLTYSAAYMLCLSNYYSGQKSERELGIHYSSTKSAVKSAIDWFKTNKYC
ncbi:NAD-dependent epimerase/dehydratase family protein [Solitalea canadensis]|uniref:NAD dependent epimerase/dehydratase family protein n=1 Tax=Solitalea canadensis (strain ATCC 29591 / DSM 3403 / JCM 21819 / LMG 8368 / NBRC 15130 / NCIMB 12057 / USAM 9D) TaxID=929556 RepID=H8KSW8_SOLCM|nr:NAD-dependent epimerase/dehydratase family protein [Solitalea canadensis]AFD05428.1 NAD dependent epimerase/dehydratase family protein [Solitalea canadensis DSM 3403]